MSVHSYPTSSVLTDLARAGCGLALCSAPLIFIADPPLTLIMIFGGLVGIFALSACQALLRGYVRVEWDETGVTGRTISAVKLPWRDVDRVKLAYYSTRRDRSNGWMQLSIAAKGRRLQVDSHLGAFDALVERAVRAAIRNNAPFDAVTRSNLYGLGIDLEFAGSSEARR